MLYINGYLDKKEDNMSSESHIGTPGGDFSSFSGIIEGEGVICRKCMSNEETIITIRGFTDRLLDEEAKTGNYTCSRCNKAITVK
jgi:hypothetical protein